MYENISFFKKKWLSNAKFEQVVIYKEWPGKIIYLNFDSIFGDFFLKFFTPKAE